MHQNPLFTQAVTILFRRVLIAIALLLMVSCACDLTPTECRIWGCDKAKALVSNEQISAQLRKEVNPPLNWLDRTSGGLTTPLGKNMGLRGWVDLGRVVELSGEVIHAAYSTDKFYTVDLRIRSISLDGLPLEIAGARFIRAEICMACIPLPETSWPQAGNRVHLVGKLKWDADGFLEVHPLRPEDIEIVNQEQDD